MEQVGYQSQHSLVLTLGPAVFDRYVATLEVTRFAQALLECAHIVCPKIGRGTAKKPDYWHRWLLRSRRKWPSCRAAK
jgi:hypothetical protein